MTTLQNNLNTRELRETQYYREEVFDPGKEGKELGKVEETRNKCVEIIRICK